MNTHRITSHETNAASRGFSLIELILIIVIMAVLAGIAFPAFKAILPVYHLRSAARELFINFKKAKIEAIKQHRTILIKLSRSVLPVTPRTTVIQRHLPRPFFCPKMCSCKI